MESFVENQRKSKPGAVQNLRLLLQRLLSFLANDFLRPHVKGLVQQILRILRESENDELTGTISKLVQNFTEEVSSISLELVQTLVSCLRS